VRALGWLFALATGVALAQDSARQFGAVVCISEAGAPWSVKARGTLTRKKSRDEMSYELRTRQESYTWRFSTNPQGATTSVGPGYLLERMAPQLFNASKPEERRQRLDATGEIREHVASTALMLRIGSKCPAKAPRPD
jgi:hypothetical protein